MITVVNRHTYQGEGMYIGRPSPLGNPFRMKDRNDDREREEVIEKYRVWLREQYRSNPTVRKMLIDLAHRHLKGENIVLKCSCKPKPCHGDVIKDAVEKIALKINGG